MADREPIQLRVDEEADGERLDRVLADALPETSRSRCQRWIEAGCVRVDDEVVETKSQSVYEGQAIRIEPPPPPITGIPPEAEPIPLTILHEDDALIVVEKPPGMVVHPGAGNPTGTLVNALLHHAGSLASAGGADRPGIIHRIDKDTSGLICVAKTDRALAEVQRQFRERTVEKVYLALASGRPRDLAGTIDEPIGRSLRNRKKMAIRVDRGRRAVTDYRVLETFSRHTFFECRPLTGRTHQIRVHLHHLGCPILADSDYSRRDRIRMRDLLPDDRSDEAVLTRQALHAASLTIDHPESGERIRFQSPLPEDMQRVLNLLRSSEHSEEPT